MNMNKTLSHKAGRYLTLDEVLRLSWRSLSDCVAAMLASVTSTSLLSRCQSHINIITIHQ